MAGMETVGYPAADFPLTGLERIPADTELASGLVPQSVYITVDDLASYATAAVALTDAATITPDVSAGNLYTVTLGGNRTLANPTNLESGKVFKVVVTQDGTGNRTLTYGTLYTFAGGTSTLTTTIGAVDMLTCTYDGTKIRAVLSAKFT